MKFRNSLICTLALIGFSHKNAFAAGEEKIITQICDDTGACTDVEPTTGLMLVAAQELTDELNKPHPFGETNEITKALKEIEKALKEGLGPNNDINIFFKETGIDDLFKRLGIKLFSN
jgi:hypothetical protein